MNAQCGQGGSLFETLVHLQNYMVIKTVKTPVWYVTDIKGKAEGLLQQAWTGPRGSRYVRAPDFLDVWHYGGGRSSALCTGRLYLRRNPWYSFLEAESTPGHVVLLVATEIIPSDTTGNRS